MPTDPRGVASQLSYKIKGLPGRPPTRDDPSLPKVAGPDRNSCVVPPAALVLLSLLAGCRSSAGDLTLIFAADQLGYLSPCGCSQHQLGGAGRAAEFLREAADAGPTLFLEGGNFLFGERTLRAEKSDQDRDKALALVRSWQVGLAGMPAAVWSVGPFDLAAGEAFVGEALAKLPVSSGSMVVEASRIKLGIVSLDHPPRDGKSVAESLRRKGARFIIALVNGPFPQGADWAAAAGADLALQAGVADPVVDTEEGAALSAAVPIFRVKDKGRGLLTLRVHVPAGSVPGLSVLEGQEARKARADGLLAVIESDRARLAGASGELRDVLDRKIGELSARRAELLGPPPAPPADRASLTYRFVTLSDDRPEAAEAAAIFREYTAATGKKNLAAQSAKVCPPLPAGALHYSGIESCRDCHAEAAAFYDHTKHARAYAALVDKGRQYDLDCVGCHVLGYGKPGGVCRLDQVGALANVQCESCHGMGSAHIASGGDAKLIPNRRPGYDTCFGCHDPDNDTGFNRERYVSFYLPGIVGPGHGLPPSKRAAR